MAITAHSETGKIKTLFIKRAAAAFINDDLIRQQWKELHYSGKPEFHKAIIEYDAFQSVLNRYADEIFYFPEDGNVTMDSIYCRDAAISTNKGMILCNMGKPERIHEPSAEQKAFVNSNFPILGSIKSPGTAEGGDVAWIDENTLAVGHTYRTNEEGIRQLKLLLDPLNVNLEVADLPHYKGPADVFHLMSILSPVDNNLAVVYSPLMPIAFRKMLLKKGYELVEVPEAEFEPMGCNVLALAPRVCLVVSGNPITKSLLEKAGCEVIEYAGNEISVKGGGGPTCLTRPVSRYV